jgi:hypothetical protein
MGAWMQYLVEQQTLPSMPTSAAGVPVTLTAVKPDGSTVNIGTINADCEGNFKAIWSPPENIAYSISAYFAGTNSYFSSYGTTNAAAVASTGPTPTPTPTPTTTSTDNTLLYAIIVAVIIAIIIGIANIIAINRHQHK